SPFDRGGALARRSPPPPPPAAPRAPPPPCRAAVSPVWLSATAAAHALAADCRRESSAGRARSRDRNCRRRRLTVGSRGREREWAGAGERDEWTRVTLRNGAVWLHLSRSRTDVSGGVDVGCGHGTGRATAVRRFSLRYLSLI
ncbi:Protein of unknown function, partial [Gryllus bimaculatus]